MASLASTKISVSGLDEFSSRLGSMKMRMRQRIMRNAIRKATTIIDKQATANLRGDDRTGQLRKALGGFVRQYKQATVFLGIVGGRAGFSREIITERNTRIRIEPTRYMHLKELGTRPHSTNSGSKLMRVRTNKAGSVARISLAILSSSKKRSGGGLHPGSKASHFLQRAVDSTAGRVEYEIWSAVDSELQK